jgi:hypothetical protein
MGKQTRNDDLAEYYLRAAGVASNRVDADGDIGAQDVARLAVVPGRIAFCCLRGSHFVLAYRLHMWVQEQVASPPTPEAVAVKLSEIAAQGGVGLTHHHVAVERALAAVATVNHTIDKVIQRAVGQT